MTRRDVSEKAIKLLCHFEGERNPKCGWDAKRNVYFPYVDPVGIPTIGIGTIMYPNGKRVTMKDGPISEKQAYEYMNYELNEKEDAVARMEQRAGLFFNQDQFDALVSMAYNCGIGILEVGTSLRTALMSRDLKKIESAMNLYVKGTVGKGIFRRKITLAGLVRRRKSEFTLYSTGQLKFY